MPFKGLLEMKLGYPCINWTIDCKGNKTFRLRSYSEERLVKTVENNLTCLKKMFNFNIKNNILFFRITSELVPFASHPICKFNWQDYFKNDFKEIGKIIKKNNIRISMHPDQFIVLNSIRKDVVKRSIKELNYHCDILDLMKLDFTSKIQLHIGGAYGDKKKSLKRFICNYKRLNEKIRNRLVIENDDKIYSLNDCLYLSDKINIPILFDTFHHSLLNNGENNLQCLRNISKTWTKKDGIPMVDYSSQQPNMRKGKHAETVDLNDFEKFIDLTKQHDFDIMLEIKDKEKSVLKVIEIVKSDTRFVGLLR
jgi:UV DNA damage endonuclease